MRKIKGFLHEARILLEQQPGMSAQQVARFLLKSGRAQSAAQNPEGSLVSTLHKHYKDIELERRKDGSVNRFYPKGGGGSPPVKPNHMSAESGGEDIVVSIRLPRNFADITDVLVGSGKYKSRNEAIIWLLEKGIASQRL